MDSEERLKSAGDERMHLAIPETVMPGDDECPNMVGRCDDEAVLARIARRIGKGVRGKYYGEYTKGTNLVLLSPDVANAFPDEESVNAALRGLLQLAQKSMRSCKPARGRK